VHRENFQVILVDTPGLHRPRTLLGQRLNDLVKDTYSEVDIIGLVHPGRREIGLGDRWIYEQIRTIAPNTTPVVVVTKIDKVSRDRVAAQLLAVSELAGPDTEIVPVSATTGENLDVLTDVLAARLPPGPAFYPDGELTDEPEEVLMAELIREAALEGVRDELPHSLAVVIEEVSPREGRDDLIDVRAILYVERDSQKGIVIGKGGARLREVGTAARTRSRSCSAPRCTSTCASRLLRTGSATRNSLVGSGSSQYVGSGRPPGNLAEVPDGRRNLRRAVTLAVDRNHDGAVEQALRPHADVDIGAVRHGRVVIGPVVPLVINSTP
jgi:GTP-binding protein Era